MSTKAILEALKAGAKIGKPLKKAVTDFIDDDFPLGTFDDKPFSKLKEQGVVDSDLSSEIIRKNINLYGKE